MNKTEIRAREILKELKIPSHVTGHAYIIDAICRVYESPEYLKHITKELYPDIAEKYDTTWHKIERAMRYSIEIMIKNLNFHDISKSFIVKPNGNISNSNFISTIVEMLKIEGTKEGEV